MLENDIFKCSNQAEFENLALQVFQFQYNKTAIYREFCDLLKVRPSKVHSVNDIPFLPIQFFKSHSVLAEGYPAEETFLSSSTTGAIPSKHHVAKLSVYEDSFFKTFETVFGNPSKYCILALLPSYLERGNSSLVYMVDQLIKKSENEDSGFYLDTMSDLAEKLIRLESTDKKTILFGVSYALLDLVTLNNFQLKNTIVIETGGMKGRRKEMVKDELHTLLQDGFGINSIHSEYGMTELLSQAYSQGHGRFSCPPWMRLLTRDTNDALSLVEGKTGGINIIDLANMYSCSFIATQDLGKLYPDGSFEILGRFDESDIRGCNLMVV